MERSREYDDLSVALAEARPTARPDFAAELDELVATGFQRSSHASRGRLAAVGDRLRALSPQRLIFATSGAALVAIVIATAIVASVDSGPSPETKGGGGSLLSGFQSFDGEEEATRSGTQSSSETQPGDHEIQRAMGELRAKNASAASATLAPSAERLRPFSRSVRHRDIERSAEISLLAEPADVADDSAQVFDAVHDARGIVLRSTTAAGSNAGAHFELLIPSRNLGDALAAFSAIDEVGSRHEATIDITAPTVSVEEQLRDSRARIDGFLAQFSTAEAESTRETVEVELRRERRHVAALQAQLERLQRRADYSRVSLRIEASDSATSSTGGWGIDDAVDDAGHILAVAAAVTIVGLAIVGPLALIALIAWLAHRLWLRRARDRALA